MRSGFGKKLNPAMNAVNSNLTILYLRCSARLALYRVNTATNGTVVGLSVPGTWENNNAHVSVG